MNKKLDIKLELIKCRLVLEAKGHKQYISDCIMLWGENYQDKDEIEYQKVCDIEARLYTRSKSESRL